ncbi:MAG TPA: hypothetical protein VK427_03550, partial [Kofleriaceae bacterium]|nr:hypothetical protein [Kofleriaceae bacterium]
MRRRLATVVLLGALSSSASAFVGSPQRRVAGDSLTAMPAAGVARSLRVQRDVHYTSPPSEAWRELARMSGGTWYASWDRATGVPNRIWGAGVPTPGANASPQVAELFARQLLAVHVGLLAPGATAADFVL